MNLWKTLLLIRRGYVLEDPAFTWRKMQKEEFANGVYMVLYLCRNEDATLHMRIDVGNSGIPLLRFIVAVRIAGTPVPSTRFTDAEIPPIAGWLFEAAKFQYDLQAVPYITLMQVMGDNFQLLNLAQDADAFAEAGFAQLEQQNAQLSESDRGAMVVPAARYSSFTKFVNTINFDEEIPDGE